MNVIYEGRGTGGRIPQRIPRYVDSLSPLDEVFLAQQRKKIEQENLYGLKFDQIMAMPEEAVNTMFHAAWKEASAREDDNLLAHFTVQNFSASFDAPTVRFLSGDRAVIWFTLTEAAIHAPKYVDF